MKIFCFRYGLYNDREKNGLLYSTTKKITNEVLSQNRDS